MIVVLVTGGRDYTDKDTVFRELDNLAPDFVIEGGAKGADSLAEIWCETRGVHYARVPALWDSKKRAAGPLRNGVMARLASALDAIALAFPGGNGTEDMVEKAIKHGLLVRRVP